MVGRPTKITYELVCITAEELLAEGKPCTLGMVQEELGGSFSTISKHYRKWKDTKGPIIKNPPKPDLPPDTLNEAFQIALSKKYTELHSDYAKKLSEKQEEVDLHIEYLERLENEKEELESSEKEAKENLLIIKGENNQLHKSMAALKCDYADLVKKSTDISEKCVMVLDENRLLVERLEKLMIRIEDMLKQIVQPTVDDLNDNKNNLNKNNVKKNKCKN
jgi:hypothetical protein